MIDLVIQNTGYVETVTVKHGKGNTMIRLRATEKVMEWIEKHWPDLKS